MYSIKDVEIQKIEHFGVTPIIVDSIEQVIKGDKIVCSFTFVPDRKPLRHYYDPQELQEWAFSDIKLNGILSPLWVRHHPSVPGQYELVAGLRRLKAAVILGLDAVPVKVFNWDDLSAFHAAISSNTNRQNFSALEELDNTLRLLEIKLEYDTEEVVSFLYRMNNATKGNTNQNVLVSKEAELVQQVFDSLGRITWQSFVTTRLPLCKKPVEILNAIRLGKIQYTKGIVIAGVKDETHRQNLLEDAISDSLSLSEIKQRVKALNDLLKAPAEPVSLKQRLTNTVQMAKKNQMLWSDKHKTKQLEQLLNQLEAIVMV
ncbi:ParB/RepB/Spo0J family partition protein [Scytonema sp. UIC 10036]|uniref:ParB/RepB/Spo0J family partition protein n=1 Tax=Scytonema sp. UIC 10036 TaxID=2304196 RepID=UPI001FA9F0C5|nr:ParB/RepB/Spo0J family partition protein [Scytonema sp. UIC 10036]